METAGSIRLAAPDTTCSFCGKSSGVVGPMAKGLTPLYVPPLHLCRPCSLSCSMIHARVRAAQWDGVCGPCDFCGRDKAECGPTVAGPGGIYICEQCTKEAVEVLPPGA